MRDRNIKKIADIYGYDAQSRQLIEEMAELTQAINKFWRKQLLYGLRNVIEVPCGTPEEKHIAEEIADVEVCLEQIKYLLCVDNEVTKIKKQKIERQLKRIAECERKV